MTTLAPIQAVRCPSTGRLVAVDDCRGCECCEEVRQPWRHYAVKCSVVAENTGVYP